jgi:hypothetical protein
VLRFCSVERNINCSLIRLGKFLNLKKEASSFAGRVVEPLLLLLNENGPVAVCCSYPQAYLFDFKHSRVKIYNFCLCLQDEAIDLLRTVIKLYPSSLNRHYNKVCLNLCCYLFSILNSYLFLQFTRNLIFDVGS